MKAAALLVLAPLLSTSTFKDSLLKECTIYAQKVQLKTGDRIREKPIVFSDDWLRLIDEASGGGLNEINAPADYGRVDYLAYKNNNKITLMGFNEDGVGVENDSPAAGELIKVIAENCNF